MSVDGIYTVYMTGAAGQGMAMFVFQSGTIAGADVTGVVFSGKYELLKGRIIGEVAYKMPADSISITGANFTEKSSEIKVPIDLPEMLDENETYRIETPIGSVNAKFIKTVAL
jgi:hypothetical protein